MANNEGQATHFVPTHKANDNTKKHTYISYSNFLL
jgi:hypothetical protein